MSFVGGIAKVTPARYEDADQSVKRLPTERRTSAVDGQLVARRRRGVADRQAGQLVRLVDRALAVPGRHDRRAEPLGQGRDLGRGLGRDRAAAGDDDRPLRVAQQRRRPLDVVGGRPDPAACLALGGVGEDDLGAVGQDVHRHVEQDRPGPAGDHLVPGPVEDERQLVDARRLPPLLDDRLEDPRVVGDVASLELLEQAGAAHVGVRRAGQQRDRGRVDVRRGHPDDRVGRPRTDAGEGEDRLAGRPVEAVGEVDGGLLVHDLHGPDRVLSVEQGVGQRPAAVARDAGHDRHALADQVLDHDLRPGQSPTTLRLGQCVSPCAFDVIDYPWVAEG